MGLVELDKKRNKYLIIYLLLAFVGTFIPIVPGAIILDGDENNIFGILLVVLGIVIFIASNICFCIVVPKLNRQILNVKCELDSEKIKTKIGSRIFKTTTGLEVEFNEGFYIVDGQIRSYNDFLCVAAFRVDKLGLIACMGFGSVTEVPLIIDLDGDLLDALKKANVKIANQEELDYYVRNIELATKQASKMLTYDPRNLLITMEFKKNKQDAKKFKKRTITSIIMTIVSILVVIALNVLLIWLGDSKEGIEFSNKLGMDIIVKLIYTIILVLLIFVKAKDYSIVSKTITGLYVVIFWISRLFYSSQTNFVIDYVFLLVFLMLGVYECYKKWKNNKNAKDLFNRYFGIGIFIAITLTFFALMDFTFVSEGLPWLYALYVDIPIALMALLLVHLNLKKNPVKTKKEKITLYISISLLALMIGYYFGIISVNGLNYALDKSEPIINSYEIIKLKNGDEESDKAIILIDGKEYSISISDYEYRTLEVGDMLEVYYYEGAFNLAYYIHYSEE